MDYNFQEMVRELGGVIIQIDPKKGSYINPLEVVDSQITVKDFFDSFGNIKPFEVVSKETGITLEMYEQAATIIRFARVGNTQKKDGLRGTLQGVESQYFRNHIHTRF